MPVLLNRSNDELILNTAATIKKIITVEENVLPGGFGSAVLELLAEKGITSVQVKCLGIPDEFVNHATQAQQRDTYGINEEGISSGDERNAGEIIRYLIILLHEYGRSKVLNISYTEIC